MTIEKKRPRKLTEQQIAKILREYGFERRAGEILRRLESMGLAWKSPGWTPPAERGSFHNASVGREWVVATKAGFLGVSIYDDWLACVFDDDEAGERFVSASRPSGKWNHHAFVHHYHGRTDRLDVVNRLDWTLARFLHGLETLMGIDTGSLYEVLAGPPPKESAAIAATGS